MIFEWTQELERRLCEKMWPIDVQSGRGKQKVGRASIFVVEEVHIMMLHRQLCLADSARKSWKAILGSRYFGPAKVVKERVGRVADFVAFDCASQEPAAHGHVAYGCKSRQKKKKRVKGC